MIIILGNVLIYNIEINARTYFMPISVAHNTVTHVSSVISNMKCVNLPDLLIILRNLIFLYNLYIYFYSSSETQGQLVGAGKSLNR